MFRFIAQLLLTVAVSFVFVSPSYAGTVKLLDNTVFSRSKGKPKVETVQFGHINAKSYRLTVFNGGVNNQYCRVSSAEIYLNGNSLLQPKDFNQNVAKIERTITIANNNTLSVKLKSKPGCAIEVNVYAEHTTPELEITSIPPYQIESNNLYRYQLALNVLSAWNDTVFSLTHRPAGMTITDGLIAWTPTNDNIGENRVTILAENSEFGNAVQSFDLVVTESLEVIEAKNVIAETTEDQSIEFSLDTDGIYTDQYVFKIIAQPKHGTIIQNTDIVIYSPVANFNGVDTFQYQILNGEISSNIATATVNVSSINDAPVIISTPIRSAMENTNYEYQVEAVDVDDQSLTFAIIEAPDGMTINASSGLLSWTPNSNQIGDNHVEISVTDPNNLTVTQIYILSVANVNDAPSIVSIPPTSTNENQNYIYQVQATDPDTDSVLTTTLEVAPVGMTISLDGQVLWTPNANQVGSHEVIVKVADEFGLSDSQTFVVVVLNVEDAPEITSSPVEIATQDLAYEYQVVAIDNDVGDTLQFSLSALPIGMNIDSASGLINWVPNPNQVGSHSVAIVVTDSTGLIANQAFNLVVSNVNDAPTITSTPVTSARELVAYSYQVAASDLDSDPVSFSLSRSPSEMAISNSGLISWTPERGQAGEHPVTVVVNDPNSGSSYQEFIIAVEPAPNTAPVANDVTANGNEDSVLNITLAANDIDADPLTFNIVSQPTNGTLTGVAPNITYTPNSNYFGVDSFTFVANDGFVDSNVGVVTINVAPMNDVPFATSLTVNGDEDTTVNINLTGFDIDGDTLTYQIQNMPVYGVLTGNAPNLIYTPNENTNGEDSFSYTANDGLVDSANATVLINLTAVNDAPVANNALIQVNEDNSIDINLSASDVDGDLISYQVQSTPTNGMLSGTAPNFTYTPNANFNGVDSFNFIANDGLTSSTAANVTISVLPINDAPVVKEVSVAAIQNAQIEILLDAEDIDGDPLVFSLASEPSNGSVSIMQNIVTYTPNNDFYGNDSFSYFVTDGVVNSNTEVVAIDVVQANVSPTIVSTPKTQADEASLYQYQIEAVDANSADTLTFELLANPRNASFSNELGEFNWMPTEEYVGTVIENNAQCFAAADSAENNNLLADVIILADESGSMAGEHQWIGELVPVLDAHLKSNAIGSSTSNNQYSLVGFGSRDELIRQLPIGSDGQDFGTAEEFAVATSNLVTNGSYEDGWSAMNFAANLPVRNNSSKSLILISDESRFASDPNIRIDNLVEELSAGGFSLNVVVDASFQCGDGRPALGFGQNDVGYVADGQGGYSRCQNASIVAANNSTEIDYIAPALSLGGAAWDVNVLRNGGTDAQSFANALIQIKVEEISSQISDQKLADLAVTNISMVNDSVTVNVKNRGLVDVTEAIKVEVKEGDSTVVNFDLSGLNSGEERELTFSLTGNAEINNDLTATIYTIGGILNECSLENNLHTGAFVKLRVGDDKGLSDSQSFVLNVSNLNQNPRIVSEANGTANINSLYKYQINVEDPDVADAHSFTLIESPLGMKVNNLTGKIIFYPSPNQLGEHTVTVQVSDLNGASDTQSFTLQVNQDFLSPRFNSSPIYSAVQATQYLYQTRVAADQTAQLKFAVLRGPDGLAIDESSGLVSWQVPANVKGQIFPVIIQVKDQRNNYDLQVFNLTGDSPPKPPYFTKKDINAAIFGEEYSVSIDAADPNAYNVLTWALLQSPSDAMIDADTGVVTWQSSVTQYGKQKQFNNYCLAEDSGVRNLEWKVKWHVNGSVANQPLFGSLFDTNANGVIDSDDQKIIIGTDSSRRINALDANSGKLLWRRSDVYARSQSVGAIVNLDSDNSVEYVFHEDSTNTLVALNSDGSTRWVGDQSLVAGSYFYNAITPVDLDNDGAVELLYGPNVFDANGRLIWSFPDSSETSRTSARGNSVAVDLDLDGIMEVVYYDQVRDHQGNLLWRIPGDETRVVVESYYAVANIDTDPEPELIVNERSNKGLRLKLIQHDAKLSWEVNSQVVGPVLIADLNGDNAADIYLPAESRLYANDGEEIWHNGTLNQNQGASIADVDGDGYLDILQYEETEKLVIKDGQTGDIKISIKNSAVSRPNHVPYFADIDNDGQGEIVAGGNSSLTVFKGLSGTWLPATKNLTYLSQNIGAVKDDMTLVRNFVPAFVGQSSLPAAELKAKGLMSDISLLNMRIWPIGNDWVINTRVINQGLAKVEAGTVIEYYKNDPSVPENKFAESIVGELEVGAYQTTIIQSISNPEDLGDEVFAVVKPTANVIECETQNNSISAKIIRVQVTDTDGLTDDNYWGLGAVERASRPEFTSTPVTSAEAKTNYSYTAVADDQNVTDSVRYGFTQAPFGAQINSLTGEISWQPSYSQVGANAFIVNATDLTGNQAVQSFTVNVVDNNTNNAPVFTSTPVTKSSAGLSYHYDANGSDVDSETLIFSLETAPDGMTINRLSGQVSWNTQLNDVGIYSIVVAVSDERGASAQQSYQLEIVSNSLPQINSQPGMNAKTGLNYSYQINATDSDNDLLTYQLINAPEGMTISESGRVTWTPNFEQTVPVTARVSDGIGYSEQSWNLSVLSAESVLSSQLTVTPRFVNEGELVSIQAAPINAIGSVTVALTVDGVVVELDSQYEGSITASGIGQHEVIATITDQYDSVTTTDWFGVRDPNDTGAPIVSIDSLNNSDTITAPTDITVSVEDDNLLNWRLFSKEIDSPANEFFVLAEGNANVVSDSIAQFDPTMLQNGQYLIQLEATDTGGLTSQTSIAVLVDGEMKVGHFSITLEDVNIPVRGIPVRMTRTYDTRQKHKQLDFGFGWSVDYQNVRVHESRVPGFGWSLNEYSQGLLSNWCVEPNGDPIVSVVLPDGSLEKFIAKANPHCQLGAPAVDVVIEFDATEDTTSTLQQISFESVRIVNGSLVDLNVPDEAVNPSLYVLTTKDGIQFHLDQHFGVKTITEPNGETLTYNPNGITHSTGIGLVFEKDALGRIQFVNLPNGSRFEYQYSEEGNLISVIDPEGNTSSYTYKEDHFLEDIVDGNGHRVSRNEYDAAGRLIATIDADGNRIELEHDIAGRREVVRDRKGQLHTFIYDENGRVLSEINALNETTSRTYNTFGLELTRTNHLGETQAWTYDNRANKTSETDAKGYTTFYDYDLKNQMVKMYDELGKVISEQTYDETRNLEKITRADGSAIEMPHDAVGQMVKMIDAESHTTEFFYNVTTGDLYKQIDANGVHTDYEYDINRNKTAEITTRTLADNSVETLRTEYEYDLNNRLTKTTYPDGSNEQIEYDGNGKEIAIIDTLQRRTEMEYNARSELVKTSYHDGTFTSITYDLNGNKLTEKDRNGNVTEYEYDVLNRVVKIVFPDESVLHTEYDAAGRVAANIDDLGNRTRYEYDKAGRRTKVIDALLNEHTFVYDSEGNLTSETDALGHTTSYEYDLLNRKIATVFHNSTRIGTEFDGADRQVAKTDQANIATRYEYDAMGRLTKVVDVLNNETSYTYDEQGNKLTQTDADNKTTHWTYDKMGRVLSRELPLGQIESFTYDLLGRTTSHTDFNGETTTYAYNERDQLASITYDDSSVESFTYDALGNRLTATNELGTASYEYDSLNRLIKETKVNGEVLEYGYDGNGNKTDFKLTYANGTVRTESFTYDALNRLTAVTDNDGNITSYGYDLVGNRTSVSYANGASQLYSYDTLNRLTKLSHYNGAGVLINEFEYTLHATGRRTQIDELNGRSTANTYDALYRLTEEIISDPINGQHQSSYTFDKVGNRLSSIINGVETTFVYDDNDRIISQGDTTYTYDNNGNTISKTLNVGSQNESVVLYDYNDKNKLSRVVTDSSVNRYRYDINDNRVEKIEGTNTTRFIVDNNQPYAQVIAEKDNTNAISKEYVFGDDLVSQSQSNQSHYYMYDGLGSTRGLTDANGDLTDSYNYEAFGELLNSTGSTDNNYLYTGEQYDAGLDNYYLRARYYDQGIGRFTQQDTWMGKSCTPITLNKYIYANADAVNGIDPSGNFTLSELTQAMNVRTVLSANGRQIGFSLIKQKGKKSVLKTLTCQVGKSYAEKQFKGDGLQGHHPINKSFGGIEDQKKIFIPANTHRMFHWILNVVLKAEPAFKGYGNWTKAQNWDDITESRAGRRLLYKNILVASRMVDKYCKLRKPNSMFHFVRKNKKSFLGE